MTDEIPVSTDLAGKKIGYVQVPKIAVRLKVTEQAIRKDMAKLQKMRLIEKRGSARATYYVLNETQETA